MNYIWNFRDDVMVSGSILEVRISSSRERSDAEDSSADYYGSDWELGGHYSADVDGASSGAGERDIQSSAEIVCAGSDVTGKVSASNLMVKWLGGSQGSSEDKDAMLKKKVTLILTFFDRKREKMNMYRYALCAFYVPLPSFLQEGDILRRVPDRNRYPMWELWDIDTLTTTR